LFGIARVLLWGIVLGGCQPEADEAVPRPWGEPDSSGPYAVGLTTLNFVDPRGKELVADVWYPASVTDEDVLATYQYTTLSGSAYLEPTVDLRHGPHPLVAFSHGYISIRYQSYFLMEHLASHGFVVIATDHPTNTLFDLDEGNNTLMMLERPDDIRYSVDHLYGLSQQPGLLEGALEDDSYAVIGHSFGAVTAMWLGGGEVDWETLAAYCAEGIGNGRVCDLVHTVPSLDDGSNGGADPRVRATVPLSPGLWYAFGSAGSGLESVAEPFVLAGALDAVLSWSGEAEPAWEALGGPKRLALFEKAGHYGFSALCELIPGFQDECDGPEAGWEDLDWIQARTNTLVLAHLGNGLLGDDRYAPWLDADEAGEPGRLVLEESP
jgi:predicted dienelactone hydrolase